jgi:cyclic pyranopterin phosphate synthase
MIDITKKPEIYRQATAKGKITLKNKTIQQIIEGKIEKGDPFQIAKVAAILAAKNTSSIIPLCHQIPLTSINVDFQIINDHNIEVVTSVKTKAQTGVEMEALTATAVALLTIWDMTKKYEKDTKGQYPTTEIRDLRVIQKIKEK